MQRRLSELDVGIATKTNGIAFPGYKSGHFVDGQGKRIFCALTRGAVLLMKCHRKLDGSAIAIAVDDTEEASQVLAQWAGAAERKAAMQTAGQQEREGRIDLIDTPPC